MNREKNVGEGNLGPCPDKWRYDSVKVASIICLTLPQKVNILRARHTANDLSLIANSARQFTFGGRTMAYNKL
jgi:hypothetical protein